MKVVDLDWIPWIPRYVRVNSLALTIPLRVPQEILVLVEDGRQVWRWKAWLN